jgi:hypothetical protein
MGMSTVLSLSVCKKWYCPYCQSFLAIFPLAIVLIQIWVFTTRFAWDQTSIVKYGFSSGEPDSRSIWTILGLIAFIYALVKFGLPR